MNLLELSPLGVIGMATAVGAGLAVGSQVASRAITYAISFTDSFVRAFVMGRHLVAAGFSRQQIVDHHPRIVDPHRFAVRCHATCGVCRELGYPEPLSGGMWTPPQ